MPAGMKVTGAVIGEATLVALFVLVILVLNGVTRGNQRPDIRVLMLERWREPSHKNIE